MTKLVATPPTGLLLSRLKRGLDDLYGERLARLVLFGSQARGDSGPHSDIDVLVIFKQPFDRRTERNRTLPLVSDLSLEHDTLISLVFVDEARYRLAQDPLMRNVRREGVAL